MPLRPLIHCRGASTSRWLWQSSRQRSGATAQVGPLTPSASPVRRCRAVPGPLGSKLACCWTGGRWRRGRASPTLGPQSLLPMAAPQPPGGRLYAPAPRKMWIPIDVKVRASRCMRHALLHGAACRRAALANGELQLAPQTEHRGCTAIASLACPNLLLKRSCIGSRSCRCQTWPTAPRCARHGLCWLTRREPPRRAPLTSPIALAPSVLDALALLTGTRRGELCHQLARLGNRHRAAARLVLASSSPAESATAWNPASKFPPLPIPSPIARARVLAATTASLPSAPAQRRLRRSLAFRSSSSFGACAPPPRPPPCPSSSRWRPAALVSQQEVVAPCAPSAGRPASQPAGGARAG